MLDSFTGGNYNWTDVKVTIGAFVPSVNGTDGVFLAARVDRGGCDTVNAQGIFLWMFPGNLPNIFTILKEKEANKTKTFLTQKCSIVVNEHVQTTNLLFS